MLSYILPLLFVTQVFARSTTDCMSLSKFTSGDFKIVTGNWTFSADEDECSDTIITVTDATQEDIKEVKDRCNGVLAELTWKANAKDNFYWDESIKKLTFSNKKYNDTLVSAHNGEFFILWECAKIENIELKRHANASVLMRSKLTPMAVQLPEGKTEVCITDNPGSTSTTIAHFEKYFQECNSASSFIIGHFSWVLGLVNIFFVRYVMSSM